MQWQFNFRGFSLADDVYAQDSIELLKQSGIDFQVRCCGFIMWCGCNLNDPDIMG